MNIHHSKTYRTQEGSPEWEVPSDTGLPKKDRNISNKQPNPTFARNEGTTTHRAQRMQKERDNHHQTKIE